MLQGDKDGDNDALVFLVVDVDAVFVMDGEELLADDGDDVSLSVIQFKIQTEDVALKLPSETFDICDVFDDMEKFVGKFKLHTVCHSDKMSLMESEELSFDVRYRFAGSRGNIGLVVD